MTTPKKLPKGVSDLLNARLMDEFNAFYFYRNASNWCEGIGYKNAAKFFAKESVDESEHAKGIEDFLTGWNVMPTLPEIAPPTSFKSLVDIIQKAYEIEYELYEAYEESSVKIFDMNDICAFDFLQKYRTIQTQSVREYSDLLNELALIDSSDKFQIYFFEKENFN